MGEEQTFEDFVKSKGLNQTTIGLLADQGFDDKDALSVLQTEDIPLLKIKQLAQRRLLERLLKSESNADTKQGDDVALNAGITKRLDQAKQPDASSRQNVDPSVSGTSLDDQLKQLLAASGAPAGHNQSAGNSVTEQLLAAEGAAHTLGRSSDSRLPDIGNFYHMRGDLNPLVYLADNKHVDYYDIVDYVPSLCIDNNEQILSSQDGSEIVLKTGAKKPKLESVSQMQWVAANSRILAKLLLEGKLGLEAVAQYLAYNVKIASLAQRYAWYSVILYDREYRRAQSAYNFAWGSDVPHLMSVHLVPIQKVSHSTRAGRKDVANVRSNYDKKPYSCRLYNNEDRCSFGSNCKFLHECNKCKGSHPGSKCSR